MRHKWPFPPFVTLYERESFFLLFLLKDPLVDMAINFFDGYDLRGLFPCDKWDKLAFFFVGLETFEDNL